MSREQWDNIEELLSQALEMPEAARVGFVQEKCNGDEELLREVSSLLDAHAQLAASPPGMDVVRSVLEALESEYYLGRRLGRYRIEAFLGSGGTGLVYRARDTESGNTVAVKILLVSSGLEGPPRCPAHPNNVRVFELATDGDREYLVMEYVEGETLARRMKRGSLALEEVRRIAEQMARGVAAAHQRGVVHGDIKPANLMIDRSGDVKVLDYSIGVRQVRGTTGYLSPEQMEAGPPDPRSDVYAMGAVIVEMLTAVSEPEDGPLRSVAGRCMESAPEDRFRDAGEVLEAIQGLARSSVRQRVQLRFVWWRRMGYAAAAVAVLMGAGLWWSGRLTKGEAAQFFPITEGTILAIQPALSPDGKSIAYASNQANALGLDIWIQSLTNGHSRRLTWDESDDTAPSYSPDGRWIVFASDRDGGGIYRVPADGGREERLASAGSRPRYSPDGRWIVYGSGRVSLRDRGRWAPRRIRLIRAEGGPPQPFHDEFASAYNVIWSPDGKSLLFTGRLEEEGEDSWWVAGIDSTKPVAVAGMSPERSGGASFKQRGMVPECWLPGGELVFQHFQGSRVTFMAVPFSIQRARFTGTPRRIAVGGEWQVNPSCGPNGEIAFSSLQTDLGLWRSPLKPGPAGMQTAPHRTATDFYPSITANGKRLVFVRSTHSQDIAQTKDLDSGEERPLGKRFERGLWLRQNAAGSLLAWSPDPDRSIPLEITDATGALVRTFPKVKRPWDFSADGSLVLAGGYGKRASITVHRRDSGHGEREILKHASMDLRNARFSPDGRWVAFTAQDGEGPMTTFVTPFRGAEEIPMERWFRGTSIQGGFAEWGVDGDALYFTSEEDGWRCLWRQGLDERTKQPVGGASAIRHFHHYGFSLMEVPRNRLTLAVSREGVLLNVSTKSGGIWLIR